MITAFVFIIYSSTIFVQFSPFTIIFTYYNKADTLIKRIENLKNCNILDDNIIMF